MQTREPIGGDPQKRNRSPAVEEMTMLNNGMPAILAGGTQGCTTSLPGLPLACKTCTLPVRIVCDFLFYEDGLVLTKTD